MGHLIIKLLFIKKKITFVKKFNRIEHVLDNHKIFSLRVQFPSYYQFKCEDVESLAIPWPVELGMTKTCLV